MLLRKPINLVPLPLEARASVKVDAFNKYV